MPLWCITAGPFHSLGKPNPTAWKVFEGLKLKICFIEGGRSGEQRRKQFLVLRGLSIQMASSQQGWSRAQAPPEALALTMLLGNCWLAAASDGTSVTCTSCRAFG